MLRLRCRKGKYLELICLDLQVLQNDSSSGPTSPRKIYARIIFFSRAVVRLVCRS